MLGELARGLRLAIVWPLIIVGIGGILYYVGGMVWVAVKALRDGRRLDKKTRDILNGGEGL